MQPKTSTCKPKDVGKALSSLPRRFFCRLSPQIQDAVIEFHIEKDDESLQDDIVQLSPTGCLEGSNLELDESSLSVSSVSKEALLSRSPCRDNEKMVAEFHQQNCLSIWKNLGSRHFQVSTKQYFHNLSLSFNSYSARGVSKIQRENRSMPEKAVAPEESALCGINTCSHALPIWRCFTYGEIASATNKFHPDNIVGKGGYAEVYKGTLLDGQVIAVKRLIQPCAEDQREKEFLVEIGIMAHVCHPNTTPLIGFCLEGGLYLIFNFYPNGSLASLLHGTKHQLLEWAIRYKVAVGIARGLHYLHEHCRRRIIHRDIKASNILLGSDFEPQISDFGLAKWLPKQWSHHSVTPVEGTFGYLAPEYFMHGIVDEKTDVYSFGVLLLEIISGRRAIDASQQSLVLWARPLLESRNIKELADPELRGSYNFHQMHYLMNTAALCVRQSSISRPSMSQVLDLLTAGYSSDFPTCWRLRIPKSDDVEDLWHCKDANRESGYQSSLRR